MTEANEYVITGVGEEILATYNLMLIGVPEFAGSLRITRKIPPEHLREIEENITDLLPADYRVVIREWNE